MLPYDPAIALLGIYPKNAKILIQRDTCTLMFIVALSIISKLWKQSKCPPTNEWIRKMCYIYIYIYIYTHTHTHTMEEYSAIKKNDILPFVVKWMELDIFMLSKMSEKNKYHRI